MILVADSGSTKTAWWMGADDALSASEGTVAVTPGINPFQMTSQQMADVMERMGKPTDVVRRICFYGAGCTAEKAPIVADALASVFGSDVEITVGSDMLGAAHASCGRNEGIVGILGTGSNSCLYDGHTVVSNVSPLGYILGDEGSGAYIGKRLVGNCLKKQLPESICNLFMEETQLTPADIIQRTYREPMPNRFLASLSLFCSRHRDLTEIQTFLQDCFCDFFVRNVALYHRPDLLVHFVGSIAWQYEAELRSAAQRCGYRIGTVMKEPLESLVNYLLCK